MSPLVPAPVRVWQLPHFWVKSCWPLSRLGLGPRSQPVSPTVAVAAAMVATSQIARPWSLRRCMSAGILSVDGDSATLAQAWGKLAPNDTSDRAEEDL